MPDKQQQSLLAQIRLAFRHSPLTEIHPHTLAAAAASEAAAIQGHFWDMHDLLFRRQDALERVRSGVATAEVLGTTTLFIDGVVHRAGYDVRTLLGVLGE